MKPERYISDKASKREAQRVLAFMEGGPIPKGMDVTLHLPPKDIKYVRTEILKLSQSGFAKLLKKETITIASWEAGRRIPDQTTTMLISLLAKHKQLRGWMMGSGLDLNNLPKAVKLRKNVDMSPKAVEAMINDGRD
jgi:hypothetical protein